MAQSELSLCDRIDEEGQLKLRKASYEELEALCSCATLRSLELRKCQAAKLPPCFAEMEQLRHLDLSKAVLPTFPMVVCQMYGLEHLSLAHTSIAYLPEEVADLPQLRHLDLRATEIESLPTGLGHLEVIDFRLRRISKRDQEEIRAQYPDISIFFSSPCHCN